MRRTLVVVVVVLALVAGTAAAIGKSRSPLRVTLTAQNHDPRPTDRPGWHWSYCVKIRTAAGKSVASTIDIQILSAHTPVKHIARISLKRGYDHWCQAIGGEDNLLLAMPRGKKLIFQAVVRADGVMVKRNWPIVVR